MEASKNHVKESLWAMPQPGSASILSKSVRMHLKFSGTLTSSISLNNFKRCFHVFDILNNSRLKAFNSRLKFKKLI